jgi:FKBP-type peptidyl-prolyl cis-trans isomerase FkpA
MKLFRLGLPLVVVGLLGLAGCFPEPEDIRKKEDEIIRGYLETNGIDAQKDHNWNYYFQTLVSNPGGQKVERFDIVGIYYKIKLLGATTILDERKPEDANPRLVKHDDLLILPSCIDLGLVRMHVGERYRFFFPSYLSYGGYANGTELPANSILEVEIEVDQIYTAEDEKNRQYGLMDEWIVTWKDQNDPNDEIEPIITESGLRVLETAEGTGPKVINGDFVTVKYKGFFRSGTVFDESNSGISLTVGAGQVISGWEEGLKYINKGGGKGILLIPSHLAYPRNPVIIPSRYNNTQITCFTDLIFEIEVL